jgi:licheninase
MSGFDGITYYFKGNAHRWQVHTSDVTDHDYFGAVVPASDDWTRVVIPFQDLTQEGWGAVVPLNLQNVNMMSGLAKGGTGDTGAIWMDDVMLVETIPGLEDVAPAPVEPDMEIEDPAPPADEVIESVDIANPLQALAMATLNKGYNITNWLEEETFEDFSVYNEQYVANLRAAGFKALRLPIDLDRYITERKAYFSGESALAIEPVLFEILDAFELWTATHGLSLTVDYHQYDASMHLEDPLDVQAAVGLWSAVAEHFAGNPREDLFFEIMNEPEQAGDVGSIAPETWTPVAEQIIEAVRNHDTDRVILFGDVEWNGISSLAKRTPFADPRIIYVFHFYEPFVFTHQGASWTGMTNTHDIPYPYSPDRWSEYSQELGFDSEEQSEWIRSLAENYYKEGNRSALRNALIEAKRWAAQHNVPVICNEFGVFDRTARLEDRIRYYTDMADIFEELAIPWQHWFMLMDEATGVVDEDLKVALGLRAAVNG